MTYSICKYSLCVLIWMLFISFVASSPHFPSYDIAQVKHDTRNQDLQSWHLLLRALANSKRSDEHRKAKTVVLDSFWQDKTLFALKLEADVETGKENTSASVRAGIEIVCETCYIKGTAKTQLTSNREYNLTRIYQNYTREIKQEVVGLTDQVSEYVSDYFDGVGAKLQDGFDLEDFAFPTMNLDFSLNLVEIPETRLRVEFDGLEIYMLLDTKLSAGGTYTLNLYSSKSAVGVSIDNDILLGVVIFLDLILDIEAEIDVRSGFHIKLEDGAALEIDMFSKNISRVILNGGEFEFLPVVVMSGGVAIKAVLRLGVKVGLQISSGSLSMASVNVAKMSSGVQVSLFANVAEFVTNVTSPEKGEGECGLQVAGSYQFALGAAAGASVAINTHTWGPVPETEIPIFSTTPTIVCATLRGDVAASHVPAKGTRLAVAERDEDDKKKIKLTTVTTTATYTIVRCQSTGLVDCPMSLQTTSTAKVTETLVKTVLSTSRVTSTASSQKLVTETIPFGKGAMKLMQSSGSPKSYTPPPSTTNSTTNSAEAKDSNRQDNETGGVSNKLIIGLSVGLGVPFLLGVGAIAFFVAKRKRYRPVSVREETGGPQSSTTAVPKGASVSVAET